MSFQFMLKRLPFALIIWALGGATCAFVLTMLTNNLSGVSGEVFSFVTTYLPFLIAIVCTLVCIVGSEQSFASLAWSVIFSVVLCMAFAYAVTAVENDPTNAAILLANSAEGTTLNPVFGDSMRVGLRFLVSVLIPTMTGSIFSWADKKRHPEKYGKAKKKSNKNKGSK